MGLSRLLSGLAQHKDLHASWRLFAFAMKISG
jgi:hypothetical protein